MDNYYNTFFWKLSLLWVELGQSTTFKKKKKTKIKLIFNVKTVKTLIPDFT